LASEVQAADQDQVFAPFTRLHDVQCTLYCILLGVHHISFVVTFCKLARFLQDQCVLPRSARFAGLGDAAPPARLLKGHIQDAQGGYVLRSAFVDWDGGLVQGWDVVFYGDSITEE
jgi:hypothetical protein